MLGLLIHFLAIMILLLLLPVVVHKRDRKTVTSYSCAGLVTGLQLELWAVRASLMFHLHCRKIVQCSRGYADFDFCVGLFLWSEVLRLIGLEINEVEFFVCFQF